jgi:hypothetical protein
VKEEWELGENCFVLLGIIGSAIYSSRCKTAEYDNTVSRGYVVACNIDYEGKRAEE